MNKARLLFVCAMLFCLQGCAALFPTSLTMEERLASFPQDNLPLRDTVILRFNSFQVPFIEAKNDEDIPFMLGLLHAHLRLGQITFFKHLVQGRVSEMAGVFANDLDHSIRLFALPHASQKIWDNMNSQERLWIERFTQGLNFYTAHLDKIGEEPPIFSLAGVDFEEFTPQDIIALSRLSAADVNWFVLLALLSERGADNGEQFWRDALTLYGANNDDLSQLLHNEQKIIGSLFNHVGRLGSNSFALAPSKTASGSAILVNDPHLGSSLPNFWLLMGIESPSYHMVGFMMAGIPVMAMARTPHLAWGGTHMRALMSDLYDVGELPLTEQKSLIKTRLWFDDEVTLRWSEYGPIITDSPYLYKENSAPLALRWVGHEVSDELGAFLQMARATNAQEFEQAFAKYSIPSLNVLYATSDGDIGKLYAGHFPDRLEEARLEFPRSPLKESHQWQGKHTALTLPITRNPEAGFIVSANDRPDNLTQDVGYFYAPSDRAKRMTKLLKQQQKFTLQEASHILQDVTSERADELATFLKEQLKQANINDTILNAWQGDYDKNSQGAVRFELLLYHIAHALYQNDDGKVPFWKARWIVLTQNLPQDLNDLDEQTRQSLIQKAWRNMNEDAPNYKNWGEMHRIRVGHILKNIPILGHFFVEENIGVSGSRSTLFKTSHNLVEGPHDSTFGSQSRFVVDMGDMDANYAILIGGEDGYLGSANFNDQTALWLKGEYIHLPMSQDARPQAFPYALTLSP